MLNTCSVHTNEMCIQNLKCKCVLDGNGKYSDDINNTMVI